MQIFIPGKPQGKGRPRYWKGHAVTPESTRTYEQMIAMLWKCERYGVSDKPIAVEITAFYLVPKSWSKKKQAAVYAGEIKPTVKPDIDNIIKIVLDGLNGVAYKDDAQVIEVKARKTYVFREQDEGVLVYVEEIKNRGDKE